MEPFLARMRPYIPERGVCLFSPICCCYCVLPRRAKMRTTIVQRSGVLRRGVHLRGYCYRRLASGYLVEGAAGNDSLREAVGVGAVKTTLLTDLISSTMKVFIPRRVERYVWQQWVRDMKHEAGRQTLTLLLLIRVRTGNEVRRT